MVLTFFSSPNSVETSISLDSSGIVFDSAPIIRKRFYSLLPIIRKNTKGLLEKVAFFHGLIFGMENPVSFLMPSVTLLISKEIGTRNIISAHTLNYLLGHH